MSRRWDCCSKRAVRNYRRFWHIFDVRKDGSYTNEQVDFDLEESIGDENRHVCEEHEAAFRAGQI